MSLTTSASIGELTTAQADMIRAELLARRAEHSVRIRMVQDSATASHEPVLPDAESGFEQFAIDGSREAVIDIDAAIARLDNGTYGSCETCRRPIAPERLEALPQSPFCIACADPTSLSSAVWSRS